VHCACGQNFEAPIHSSPACSCIDDGCLIGIYTLEQLLQQRFRSSNLPFTQTTSHALTMHWARWLIAERACSG